MSEDAQIHYASDIVVRVRHNAAVRVEMSEQGPQGPAGDITVEMSQALSDAQAAHAGAVAAETGAKVAEQGAAAQRLGAETAQAGAEAARVGANIERVAAETSRQASEVARQGSETARTGAQTARTGAEAARAGVETTLSATTTARDQAIAAKDQAVSENSAAQAARTGAQTAQQLAAQNEQATAGLRDEVLEALGDTEAARNQTFTARDQAQTAAQSSIDTAAISITLRSTPAAGTNIGTVVANGIYFFPTAANITTALGFPSASRTGRLIVMANGTRIIQEYTDDAAVNSWMRVSTNSGTSWTSWSQIYNAATLSTPNQAEAEAGSATNSRVWTSQRVRQNVAAYASPLGHKHVAADITDLQAAIDARLSTGHQHEISAITGLQSALDAKAPLASPALTGTPTAPTPAAGTNSAQIATTAFVKAALDALVASAPGVLDTLDEIAAALGDDPNFATTMTAQLAGKAALVHAHNAADINAGVLDDARLPSRIGPVSHTVTDWNAATTNGWFMGIDALNAPLPGYWFVGSVVVHNALWVTQTVWGFASNTETSNTETHYRECNNGVWTPWQRIWQTEGELDARYHTKAAVSGLLAAKASLSGADFTGVVQAPGLQAIGATAMLTTVFRDDWTRWAGFYATAGSTRIWDSSAGDIAAFSPTVAHFCGNTNGSILVGPAGAAFRHDGDVYMPWASNWLSAVLGVRANKDANNIFVAGTGHEFQTNEGLGIAATNGGKAGPMVSAVANPSTGVVGAATIAFHRWGVYAAHLGLDTDNNLRWGGWSAGPANLIWHDGNLPASAHGKALLNAANGVVSRQLLGASRNYAGAQQVANNAAPSTESGKFFNMDLAAGVNVFNLPAVAAIQDGHTAIVRATGVAAYGAAYVLAEEGKTIVYREISRRAFNLIGRGEIFRFTWLAGLNIWLAECLAQPGRVDIFRSHAGSGVWNGTPAAWNTMFFNQTIGYPNSFGYSGYAALAPVIGVYDCTFAVRFSAAVGGNVSGYGYLSAAEPTTNTVNQGIAQTYHNFFLGEDDDLLELGWTMPYDVGQYINAFYLTNTGALYHYYDANQAHICLISR